MTEKSEPLVRTKRRKRSPEEARREALAGARTLLLDEGPQALTLARVGAAIGMSHTNIISPARLRHLRSSIRCSTSTTRVAAVTLPPGSRWSASSIISNR